MLRLSTKIAKRLFSTNIYFPSTPPMPLPPCTLDASNLANYLLAPNKASMSFLQKISQFTPMNIYNTFDQLSRELLFTLANDYQLGLPVAVILVSCALRLLYFYPNMQSQMGALKMKQMKPIMDRFKQKSRIAQMTRNTAMLKMAREQLLAAQRSKGIDNFYAFVNITQIPFLIVWFLSLRYIAALPEVYPSATQGFAWVSDLSAYDPYFILPLISACLSSYAISISPALKSNNVMPLMETFAKYMKYMPFVSLPITGFFPAILNLYWCTLAINQVLLMTLMNNQTVLKYVDKSTQIKKPQAQIQQAVFIEQKSKQIAKAQSQSQQSTQASTGATIKNAPPAEKSQEQTPILKAEQIQILSKKPKKAKKQPQ